MHWCRTLIFLSFKDESTLQKTAAKSGVPPCVLFSINTLMALGTKDFLSPCRHFLQTVHCQRIWFPTSLGAGPLLHFFPALQCRTVAYIKSLDMDYFEFTQFGHFSTVATLQSNNYKNTFLVQNWETSTDFSHDICFDLSTGVLNNLCNGCFPFTVNVRALVLYIHRSGLLEHS